MRQITVKREWKRNQYAIVIDGMLHATETEWISCDDWRVTPFGPVNFGFVRIGGTRNLPTVAAS